MKAVIKVHGMSCVNCARTIERTLKNSGGVREVEVSFELGRVVVDFDPAMISQEQIARIIEGLGYRVVDDRSRKEVAVLALSAVSSALIVVLILTSPPWGLYLQAILSTLVQVFGGWKFYRGAYTSLKNGVAGMDVLVSLGTSGAYIYSLLVFFGIIGGKPFFETNALLITFVLSGRLIEEFAKRRALRILSRMLGIHRAEVTVLRNGRDERVNVREVFRGERILARTGDMVPLDGRIVKGKAWVSEAVVTGEPEPILKSEGDRVISGSIVEEGMVEIEVAEGFEGSFLTRISRIIEEAVSEKPRIQRVVDRVSHYFVQIVVFIAVGVFIYWFLSGAGLQQAVMFSLAVLVISCPCALGIATPLAVVVGITQALTKGILIKKPSVIEVVPHINTVIFDKTGTVTEGRYSVTGFHSQDDSALDIAYTLEKYSNHPIARAIREFARQKGAKDLDLGECREVIGKGVLCGEYFIGDEGGKDSIKRVVLKKGEDVIAVFELSDRINPHAKGVISELKAMGMEVILLSGDREEIVRKLAEELGFDRWFSGALPEQKREIVKNLQKNGKRVAMVGDGVNDAPALAQADFSLVVPQGTDIAKHVGDVVLIGGIKVIPQVFSLGRSVKRKIYQNLGWAFIYNALGIPVAGGLLYGYGIYLRPEIAGLMMSLSSLSVVLNTLLMRYNIHLFSKAEDPVAQSPGYRPDSPQRAGTA